MTFRIYHQLGHNSVWNFDSYRKDSVGEGFILSPRHMEPGKVDKLSSQIRSSSIFDPQFFLPDSERGSLNDYPFFPQVVSGGFETKDYLPSMATASAELCVDYQREKNFEYIVIPTRCLQGTPSGYISGQDQLFVAPFLKYIAEKPSPQKEKVALQLILNEYMLKDTRFRNDVLNWVTSIDEISAIYLIVSRSGKTKQIQDIELLTAVLEFIYVLRDNDMEVILGYLNTEAILLSLADPSIVTIGSYETSRVFKLSAFEPQVENDQRPPTPRIYSKRLLQNIDWRLMKSIETELKDEGSIFEANKYTTELRAPAFQWHAQNAVVYKHYFLGVYDQLSDIRTVKSKERYELVCDILKDAQRLFEKAVRGVALDPNSTGEHINLWLTAAHQFAQTQGWR